MSAERGGGVGFSGDADRSSLLFFLAGPPDPSVIVCGCACCNFIHYHPNPAIHLPNYPPSYRISKICAQEPWKEFRFTNNQRIDRFLVRHHRAKIRTRVQNTGRRASNYLNHVTVHSESRSARPKPLIRVDMERDNTQKHRSITSHCNPYPRELSKVKRTGSSS